MDAIMDAMDKKVLIAEDDEGLLFVLEGFFKDKGYSVVTAADGHAAMDALAGGPYTFALVDINMPGKGGFEVLKEANAALPPVEVIVMTAETTMKNALDAIKGGAYDYITKPFDLDELELVVDRCSENSALKREIVEIKQRIRRSMSDETVFIGKSKAMQHIFKTVAKVAASDVTLLILGESGTGKEVLARFIHVNSPRCGSPFVELNSAAIPLELMESELFGHEKGAFTGATESRKGKFELASGGTLFLDEIGDMSPELQSKLLRAIEDRRFYRLGAKEPVSVDVRIIAATNHDLEKAVAEGRFREDLYYRLNVVGMNLPPLRKRKGDVSLLTRYFLKKIQLETGETERTLTREAVKEMEGYYWPGNVRELENALKRAVLLSPNLVLTREDLALPGKRIKTESIEDMITERLEPFIDMVPDKGREELYDTLMPFMERPLLKLVLKKTGYNQVRTAELLGINRNTLRKKIKELRISLKQDKD